MILSVTTLKSNPSVTQIEVPPSARQKFWPSNQAGEKEGGWGEGIFARLFCAVGAVGWEAFPPFGIKPNIKAKQFSNPFKRKVVARKIKIIERKLFCFARRSSAGGNAGSGFQIIRAIFARKRFELRSVIATNSDILEIEKRLIDRSPRLRRGFARRFSYISAKIKRLGKIKNQFSAQQAAVRSNFFRKRIDELINK